MGSRTSRWSRLAVVAAVAIALLVGMIAPRGWSSAQEQDELVGDYAVSIGSNDIPKDLANGSILVGRWHVAFQADGSYYAERLDIGRVVSGSWEVDGETLTVTDEEGIVSCSNASAATGDQGDVSTGTYSVVLDDELLALTAAEDSCRSRSVLFGTRDFGVFVACLTNAPVAEATPDASPVSEDDDDFGEGKGGQTNDGGLFDLLTPAAGQDDDNSDDEDTSNEDSSDNEDVDPDQQEIIDAEIDALLAQMTACWQTQDADQFLPLLTADFREAFLGAGTEEEQKAEIEELMIQPLVWERAGDIELDGDDEASVVVRLSIAGADQFLTYFFVLEDDAWLWDGSET